MKREGGGENQAWQKWARETMNEVKWYRYRWGAPQWEVTGSCISKRERRRVGINELPSYCTQVWPPTRERKKGETEEQGSDEGHRWFSRGTESRGGEEAGEGLRKYRAVRKMGKREREDVTETSTAAKVEASVNDRWPGRPLHPPPFHWQALNRLQMLLAFLLFFYLFLKLSYRDDFLASWHSLLKTYFCHFRGSKAPK